VTSRFLFHIINEYVRFLVTADGYLPAASTDRGPGPLRELGVHQVTLQYPDRDRPAVDEVSLTIRAGETVALVGENGSGKSTLAAMIAGLRAPTGGTISWNGEPYAAWAADGLRAHIAVAVQEHHKWPFSASTNIAMGDIDSTADPARISSAAAMAAAHEMIEELPHGYDTLLDRTFKDGQDLSGGQWQRITAARGFYRDAPLLIMDEPSSALDPRAEDALFQALRGRQGRHTTILITHRLANVIHADRIYVLDRGAVVDSGPHADLIERGGLYADLFRLQAAGYQART